jgi:hypothetical protein
MTRSKLVVLGAIAAISGGMTIGCESLPGVRTQQSTST